MRKNNYSKLSLTDKAYLKIKNDIIDGKFEPGEELTETSLAEMLSISRTPVRQALYKLEAEGLIQNIPNKGFIVTKLGLKDILEIMQVREALEGMAARLACQKINKEELDEIISLFPPFDKKLEKKDFIKAYNAGNKLHQFIYEKSDNRIIKQQLSLLNIQIKTTTQIAAKIPGRYEKAHKEHKAIIDALLAQDPDLAETKMREHISQIRSSIVFEFVQNI